MPLKQSSTNKARDYNLLAEIDAGEPAKQAAAISYRVQRKNAGKRKKDK